MVQRFRSCTTEGDLWSSAGVLVAVMATMVATMMAPTIFLCITSLHQIVDEGRHLLELLPVQIEGEGHSCRRRKGFGAGRR